MQDTDEDADHDDTERVSRHWHISWNLLQSHSWPTTEHRTPNTEFSWCSQKPKVGFFRVFFFCSKKFSSWKFSHRPHLGVYRSDGDITIRCSVFGIVHDGSDTGVGDKCMWSPECGVLLERPQRVEIRIGSWKGLWSDAIVSVAGNGIASYLWRGSWSIQ